MNVTLILDDPCAVCGCRRRGYRFPAVRINKKSLRSAGPYLAVLPQACPECGWNGPAAMPQRWRLDPADAHRVTAARARRWPGEVVEATGDPNEPYDSGGA